MIRLATIVVWLNMTRFLLWNVGSPAPGEWLVWCGDWIKLDGRYQVAALLDDEGLTFTFIDDADREHESDFWEWRIGPRAD
jgi:hypothetical protein